MCIGGKGCKPPTLLTKTNLTILLAASEPQLLSISSSSSLSNAKCCSSLLTPWYFNFKEKILRLR